MHEDKDIGLIQSNQILDLFSHMQMVNAPTVVNSTVRLEFPKESGLQNNEMCFYRVEQLSYDEDYPHREAFENVLLSLDNQAFNFVYVLTGTEEGVELCLGIVKNQNENQLFLGKQLSAVNYGEIISGMFEGNFSGSKLKRLNSDELKELVGFQLKERYKNAGAIVGIPSVNEKDSGSEYDFQGVDRLINSMLGLEWRVIIVCEPVSKKEILELQEDIYELYNRLSVYSKTTMQRSINDGQTVSFGKSTSESKGKNWGFNKSNSESKDHHGDTWGSGEQYQEGSSEGSSLDHTSGSNQGLSMNRGTSTSVTVEIANKHAEEIMKYINEELLERMRAGYSKGLFKSSVYYMAKEPTHADRLKASLISLFQGDKSSYSPLCAQRIDINDSENFNILRTYQSQYIDVKDYSGDALILLGRPFSEKYIGLNTYLTANEVSLIAGLPQKEVPGLILKESVGFGLNEKEITDVESINLGNMVQKERELTKIPFKLSRKCMSKHTFIAGVTGSGKTTTCHRLLSEAHMPFLVIEPAKTEYRTLINQYKDLVVFTLGNETVAPFRINPFELIEGEVISAHVDMIKATFTSAFPMEASMPQILEEAIYKCYEKKGWDIHENRNTRYGKEAFDPRINSFPILSDLLSEMREVVESKHFSAQMQADYIGSLVSRLSNLTVGSKGHMLNSEHSTDFNYFINHNVVLEMEDLRSPEDKALLMGFVLTRLSAMIKIEHDKYPDYRHLTLIEEAHRLLSKVEYGDSGSKKAAVETFTDLLAEVRKYGEGLIVVDQIPNKLASEVLKNTNTKIIHKILAGDDKEAVGDTMLMDEKQKEYLSSLPVGNAIVFSENTDKPIHVRIQAISNTSEKQISNELVRERFQKSKDELGYCYDEEGMDTLYSQYESVIKDFSCLKVDQKKCKKLKEDVERMALIHKKEHCSIWKKLICYQGNRSGFNIKNQKNIEIYTEELIDFFMNIFGGEDFSDDDLCSEQYTKPIYLYFL